MDKNISELISLADRYAKEGNYKKAIEKYEEAQSLDKNNLEVIAKKGFSYLLMGNEKAFISIYHKIKPLILEMEFPPPFIHKLWNKYESTFTKVVATTLVFGALTATSCRVFKKKQRRAKPMYMASAYYEKPVEVDSVYTIEYLEAKEREGI